MARSPAPVPHLSPDTRAQLRALPSVDELLTRPALAALAQSAGRTLVTDAIRTVLAALRAELTQEATQQAMQEKGTQEPADSRFSAAVDEVDSRILAAVESQLAFSLRRVINATGVILHTNLGRAPLSAQAVAAITESAGRYSNLEYEIATGERGKRDTHTSPLLEKLSGAELAIVVNNNAAAVFLVLNTLAKGAEVIVSRGELIEIGDNFRIPDIMSESGAILHEVGTTNRTRIRDYERAINERTRLLLRVHPSNFRITGFTERPSLEDLVALGQRAQLPVYEDLGSGCLADLSANGIAEPVVRASCEAGASIVSFSGDKLLGGPQAGIIAGKKEFVERIRRNPLFRALRVDKLTIAALEATLQSYQRAAFDEIPALRMIRISQPEIRRRATQFVEGIGASLPPSALLELQEGFSVIGGGATPDQQLRTVLIAIASQNYSAASLEQRLRTAPKHAAPVIARIESDRVVLDLRTVSPEEENELAAALAAALA
jgi:L-seryl-tRNA(Ser) seleniumtransferase